MLQEELTRRAVAFDDARFGDVVDILLTPTSVYVEKNMLMINDLTDAEQFLAVYFNNLVKMGHAYTNTQVLQDHDRGSGRISVRARTIHYSKEDLAITAFEAEYFGRYNNSGQFKIELIETSKSHRGNGLLNGIPLI